MSLSITLPANYGLVLLSCTLGPFMTSTFVLGGQVMKAREKFNVHYPNLYATPGYHKDADAFNRVQRGHQSLFESVSTVTTSTLVGGLQYPIFCASCALIYFLGSILYQKGYADVTLEVKTARYKKGGMLKWVGLFGSLGAAVRVAGNVQGWW